MGEACPSIDGLAFLNPLAGRPVSPGPLPVNCSGVRTAKKKLREGKTDFIKVYRRGRKGPRSKGGHRVGFNISSLNPIVSVLSGSTS